jgi:hypothetical protein
MPCVGGYTDDMGVHSYHHGDLHSPTVPPLSTNPQKTSPGKKTRRVVPEVRKTRADLGVIVDPKARARLV